MSAHYVICPICKQRFNRDKTECIEIGKRYAHVTCAQDAKERLSQEEKDKQELEEYIMKLFGTKYVEPIVQKQIRDYITKNNYLYSGIRKALIYFYEVKHGDKAKANRRISIVPYVYEDAYNYYYSLWEAQQKNQDIKIKPPEKTVREVIIPPPKRQIKLKRIFTFLDKDKETQ